MFYIWPTTNFQQNWLTKPDFTLNKYFNRQTIKYQDKKCKTKYWLLTNTLAVDTSLVLRTGVVATAADGAHEVVADLAAATVTVASTQGLADTTLHITLLVAETTSAGRAHWTADGVVTSGSRLAVTVLRAGRGGCAYTCHLQKSC